MHPKPYGSQTRSHDFIRTNDVNSQYDWPFFSPLSSTAYDGVKNHSHNNQKECGLKKVTWVHAKQPDNNWREKSKISKDVHNNNYKSLWDSSNRLPVSHRVSYTRLDYSVGSTVALSWLHVHNSLYATAFSNCTTLVSVIHRSYHFGL